MRLAMSHFSRWFLLLVLLAGLMGSERSWAEATKNITIRLFEAHPGLHSLVVEGPFEMRQPIRQAFPARRYELSLCAKSICLREPSGHSKILQARQIILRAISPAGIRIRSPHLAARQYPGELRFRVRAGGSLEILNTVPVQTYVAIVTGSETFPNWPLEALKAQAVLTQTRLSRSKAGVIQGDSTQQEVYLGSTHLHPDVLRAVQLVWGQVLTFQGQAMTPFYHAACAGQTSDGRFLSGKPLPYLTAVRDPYCQKSPFSQPTRTLIATDAFARIFSTGIPTVLKADAAGRPLRMRLGNGKELSGYDFWILLGQRFGWDKAPGTRFSVSRGSNGKIEITSTGAGHGVGLCQHGAAEMARQGKSYREILQFYFPKTHLQEQR